jgi:conjugal transfer pilus assembly protein TraF
MVKLYISIMLVLLLSSNDIMASNNVVGWHWYNIPTKQTKRDDLLVSDFNKLPPAQQLKILQNVTVQMRDKAVLSGKVSDITNYKRIQDFWTKKATLFTVGWEKMLLNNPNLNYSLSHPHENALSSIVEQNQLSKENIAIKQIAQQNGLIFFYRGANKSDILFSKIISHYSKIHNISLIPVSIDNQTSPVFTHFSHKNGRQKASALNIGYFPALVLVNTKTHRSKVISYGFKSENELSSRMLKIYNGWRANF